ncbi:MAG: hypothetical protein M5U09_27350 [Gammaproteobacteria bacterium]|nr:hypothetical protein [Gammaproteobacteria bacterium]
MLLIVLAAALSGFALGNLAYAGMWYDEAVQFWIARGLSPFAPPLQAAGGIADAVRLNAVFNLDPGGFTLLVYIWSKIDTGFALAEAASALVLSRRHRVPRSARLFVDQIGPGGAR